MRVRLVDADYQRTRKLRRLRANTPRRGLKTSFEGRSTLNGFDHFFYSSLSL